MNRPAAIVLPSPVLNDRGVRLRPWRTADAPELAAAWDDPAVVAGSVPPVERGLDAAQSWIAGTEERRITGRALDLVIADPDDDRVLGEVGIAHLDSVRRAGAVGWWVAADERGRGVATAAVAVFVDWVLGHVDAVVAEIAPGNPASEVVATRAGFELVRPATGGRPAAWVCRAAPGRAAATLRSRP